MSYSLAAELRLEVEKFEQDVQRAIKIRDKLQSSMEKPIEPRHGSSGGGAAEGEAKKQVGVQKEVKKAVEATTDAIEAQADAIMATAAAAVTGSEKRSKADKNEEISALQAARAQGRLALSTDQGIRSAQALEVRLQALRTSTTATEQASERAAGAEIRFANSINAGIRSAQGLGVQLNALRTSTVPTEQATIRAAIAATNFGNKVNIGIRSAQGLEVQLQKLHTRLNPVAIGTVSLTTATATLGRGAVGLTNAFSALNIGMFGVLNRMGAVGNILVRQGPILGALAIGGFAAAGAFKFLGDSVKVAGDVEHQLAGFRTAAMGMGKDVKEVDAVLQQFTGSLVKMGTVAETAKMFTISGIGLKDTLDLLKGAEKFAIGTGQSIEEVFSVLRSSIKGETETLKNIGLAMNLDVINKKYSEMTGKAVENFTELDRTLALTIALKERFAKATGQAVKPLETLVIKTMEADIAFQKFQATIGRGEGILGKVAMGWQDFTRSLWEWLTPANQAIDLMDRMAKLKTTLPKRPSYLGPVFNPPTSPWEKKSAAFGPLSNFLEKHIPSIGKGRTEEDLVRQAHQLYGPEGSTAVTQFFARARVERSPKRVTDITKEPPKTPKERAESYRKQYQNEIRVVNKEFSGLIGAQKELAILERAQKGLAKDTPQDLRAELTQDVKEAQAAVRGERSRPATTGHPGRTGHKTTPRSTTDQDRILADLSERLDISRAYEGGFTGTIRILEDTLKKSGSKLDFKNRSRIERQLAEARGKLTVKLAEQASTAAENAFSRQQKLTAAREEAALEPRDVSTRLDRMSLLELRQDVEKKTLQDELTFVRNEQQRKGLDAQKLDVLREQEHNLEVDLQVKTLEHARERRELETEIAQTELTSISAREQKITAATAQAGLVGAFKYQLEKLLQAQQAIELKSLEDALNDIAAQLEIPGLDAKKADELRLQALHTENDIQALRIKHQGELAKLQFDTAEQVGDIALSFSLRAARLLAKGIGGKGEVSNEDLAGLAAYGGAFGGILLAGGDVKSAAKGAEVAEAVTQIGFSLLPKPETAVEKLKSATAGRRQARDEVTGVQRELTRAKTELKDVKNRMPGFFEFAAGLVGSQEPYNRFRKEQREDILRKEAEIADLNMDAAEMQHDAADQQRIAVGAFISSIGAKVRASQQENLNLAATKQGLVLRGQLSRGEISQQQYDIGVAELQQTAGRREAETTFNEDLRKYIIENAYGPEFESYAPQAQQKIIDRFKDIAKKGLTGVTKEGGTVTSDSLFDIARKSDPEQDKFINDFAAKTGAGEQVKQQWRELIELIEKFLTKGEITDEEFKGALEDIAKKGTQADPMIVIPKDRSTFSFAPRSYFFRSRAPQTANLGSNDAGRVRSNNEVYNV